MIKFAVISFPGTNCETETLRAFKRNGMDAELVLWNDKGLLDGSRLDEFAGYAIAGGFSYEDRGRSGVVAAQDPITEVLKAEADRGKVVLGICNGAQILVETGLIPGFEDKGLGVALAWNEMRDNGKLIDTGFYNAWARLKNVAPKGRSAFNDFDELLHIPFAHGEGRFVVDEDLLGRLEKGDQILFKYCDKGGKVDPNYPTTPNGATASIAALCNPAGNVMAMMPHPERDPMGNGNLIFQSIRHWIEAKKQTEYTPLGKSIPKDDIMPMESFDIEFYVRLIITDNAERTIEEALARKGHAVSLSRFEFFGINLKEAVDAETVIPKIMASGELANFNKHLVYAKTAKGLFLFDPSSGLTPKELPFEAHLLACDRQDFVGQSKANAINAHAGDIVEGLRYGIFWGVSAKGGGAPSPSDIQSLVGSRVLHNPHSMYLMR